MVEGAEYEEDGSHINDEPENRGEVGYDLYDIVVEGDLAHGLK